MIWGYPYFWKDPFREKNNMKQTSELWEVFIIKHLLDELNDD